MKVVLTALLVCLMASHVVATDIWVDATNGSNGNSGLSQGQAKQTISGLTGAMAAASSGDVIRVVGATYSTTTNGEVFPILVKDNVRIIGNESSEVNYPVIGGDVADSTIDALFRIDASTAQRNSVSIKYLRFAAEDSAGKDAPCAVRLVTRGGYTLNSCVLDNLIVERLAMNDSSYADKPAIMVDAGYGTIGATVQNCTLVPTARGAIEGRVDANADSSSHEATIDLTVTNTTVTVSGSQSAEFGIQVRGAGTVYGEMLAKISDCTIDASAATSGYIDNGLVLASETTGSGDVSFHIATIGASEVVWNGIKNCRTNGLVLRASQVSGTGYIALQRCTNNTITGCGSSDTGGAGILLDWGSTSAYINFMPKGNVIAKNYYGIRFNGHGGGGFTNEINDTVVANTSYGYYSADTDVNNWPLIENGIVYYNNGGTDSSPTAQHSSAGGWDPEDNSGSIWIVQHSCWQNLNTSTADPTCTASSPQLANYSSGDYHLTCSSSPCIDKGTNSPSQALTRADMDGQNRQQALVSGQQVIVDMGADEKPTGTCP